MFHEPIVPAPPLPEYSSVASATRICRRVVLCVARDFGLDAELLIAPTRGSPRAAFARQVSMYLAHVGFALSFEGIGRVFGRDRTTVSHACRVIEDCRDDLSLDCRLSALEMICGPAFEHGSETVQPVRRGLR